jgi:hypothetical protein
MSDGSPAEPPISAPRAATPARERNASASGRPRRWMCRPVAVEAAAVAAGVEAAKRPRRSPTHPVRCATESLAPSPATGQCLALVTDRPDNRRGGRHQHGCRTDPDHHRVVRAALRSLAGQPKTPDRRWPCPAGDTPPGVHGRRLNRAPPPRGDLDRALFRLRPLSPAAGGTPSACRHGGFVRGAHRTLDGRVPKAELIRGGPWLSAAWSRYRRLT